MNRILLIARREYFAYAKTVGFWLSLLALPMFAVLGGSIPFLIRSTEPVRAVALVEQGPDSDGLAAFVTRSLEESRERQAEVARKASEQVPGGASKAVASLTESKIRFVPASAALKADGVERETAIKQAFNKDTPKDQRLDGVVYLSRENGEPVAQIWTPRAGDSAVSDFVRSALRTGHREQLLTAAGVDPEVIRATREFQPTIRAFSPNAASGGEVSMRDRLPAIIGLISGFLLWSLIITGASILLNSVMEEKANRILEVLLSSASPTEILTGKVLGVALLTLTVLGAWAGIGFGSLFSAAPEQALHIGQILIDDGMLGYFIAYMIGGYLMYAVLFAAIGAFCETPRDAQTLMGPIMMILVVPIIVLQMALQTPDAPLVKALSWVPFFTPFLMPARAAADLPLIEVILTLAGMFVTALIMVWIAGRAFRAGALSDVKLSWKSFGHAISRKA